MCRATYEGGRRCPCSYGQGRSAYRKALAAAQKGTPIGAGGTGPVDVPQVEPTWVDLACQVRDDLAMLDEHVPRELPRDELDSWYVRQDAARERIKELGGKERAVIAAGDALAREAEQRAGVSGQIIAQRSADHSKVSERESDLARAAAQEAQRAYEATPEYAAEREAFNALISAVGVSANHQAKMAHDQAKNVLEGTSEAHNLREAQLRLNLTQGDRARGSYPGMDDDIKALSAAYAEVLAETVPCGNVTTRWSTDTRKNVAETFDAAAQIFPTSWLEAHNAGPVALARQSRARAYYTSGTMKTKRAKRRVTKNYIGKARPADRDSVTYRPATDEEWEVFQHAGEPREHFWVGEVWNTWQSYGDPVVEPRGRGWEYLGNNKFRRPSTYMATVAEKVVAEIITGGSLSTSRHELAHRFEHVMPAIALLERDFLDRRTTDAQTGERDEAIPRYNGRRHRGKKELSTADSFADAYMGKRYYNRNGSENTNHYEVLSTGVQAIFHGENGGLVGAGRVCADPEMRAFVLGILATVQPKPRT